MRKLLARMLILSAAALLLSGCPDLNQGQGAYVPPASYDTGGGGGTKDATGSPTDTTSAADTKTATDTKTSAADTKSSGDAGAPSATSCVGKCGAKYNPTLACQCNDACAKFGNCCKDYGPVCKPQQLSCKGRCGAVTDKGALCQCNWTCGRFGTCCPDFLGLCEKDTNLDMQFADAEEVAACDKIANLHNVKYTKDGDTFELIDGSTVRFLVVNTPELSKKDCYAQEAFQWTKAMDKKVKTVCLLKDPAEGDVDVYGRLLRYIYYKDPAGGGKWVNMNLRLVRLGLGPVFYPYASGQKWEKMGVLMQQKARQDKVGGWGACGWK